MARQFFKSMRSASGAFWAGAILILICLAARLLWGAAHAETGIPWLEAQWRDATLGWFTGDYEPIYTRLPSQQADFWLRETTRVVEAHESDAQLVMGAAIVLDSPNNGFAFRFIKRLDTLPSVGTIPDIDRDGIKRAEDNFENQCKNRCLELADKACKLDPRNTEWWRLNALLLRRCSLNTSDESPRGLDWLIRLDECGKARSRECALRLHRGRHLLADCRRDGLRRPKGTIGCQRCRQVQTRNRSF